MAGSWRYSAPGTNLVANTLAGSCHIYLRDLQAGTTQLIDADTNGVGAGVDATARCSFDERRWQRGGV